MKAFGKARVPGCQCTSSFTCRKCLDAMKPYYFTSNDGKTKTDLPSRPVNTDKEV